jgi:hypothetical protein
MMELQATRMAFAASPTHERGLELPTVARLRSGSFAGIAAQPDVRLRVRQQISRPISECG